MGRAVIDAVVIFEVILAVFLLIAAYGWYLMFGPIFGVLYLVGVLLLLFVYYLTMYRRY